MSASGPEIVEWRQKVAEPPTLQPSQVEVVVALDESTARECYHIRHEVFANEMGMTPSTSSRMLRDRFDGENRTVNLLALCDGEPAAATRLILPRSNTFTDFPLEQLFRLEGLPRAEVAELPSSAVLARFRSTRRLIATLWTTTAAFARDEYGIEVLVAGVNIGTDDLGEGLMVFTALTDQGATHPSARAIPLTPHTQGPIHRRLPVEEMARMPDQPPKMAGLFRRFGGLCMGVPCYDSAIGSCTLPMYFDVATGIHLGVEPTGRPR